MLNFKVSGILVKKIVYIGDCSSLSDDSVRFCLLHEEGHIIQKQNFTLFRALVLLLSSPVLVYLLYAKLMAEALAPLFYLIFLFCLLNLLLLPRVFREHLMKDEISSDIYACNTLRAAYGIQNPSVVADVAFSELDRGGRHIALRNLLIAIGLDAHPAKEDRVAIIRTQIDGVRQ